MMETFSIFADMWLFSFPRVSACGSDAAARLGNPGDLRRFLRWPVREQLVKLLDGNAGGLAEHADGRAGTLGVVLVPHELDDLPVPFGELGEALLAGQQWSHLLAPLRGVGEESLVVDGD